LLFYFTKSKHTENCSQVRIFQRYLLFLTFFIKKYFYHTGFQNACSGLKIKSFAASTPTLYKAIKQITTVLSLTSLRLYCSLLTIILVQFSFRTC